MDILLLPKPTRKQSEKENQVGKFLKHTLSYLLQNNSFSLVVGSKEEGKIISLWVFECVDSTVPKLFVLWFSRLVWGFVLFFFWFQVFCKFFSTPKFLFLCRNFHSKLQVKSYNFLMKIVHSQSCDGLNVLF